MFNPSVENLYKWNGKTFHVVDYELQDVHPRQNISVTQKIKYDTPEPGFFLDVHFSNEKRQKQGGYPRHVRR